MHKDNGLMQKETDSLGPVVMDEQGRVHLPPSVMEQCVKGRSACRLWFDDRSRHLGIKLVEPGGEARHRIVAVEGPGGAKTGCVDTGEILRKFKMDPPRERTALPIIWKAESDFIEIGLGGTCPDSIPKKKVDTSKTKNLFDDYEPL